jgi:hypothetical protein
MCENPIGHIAKVDQARTKAGESLDKILTNIDEALKLGKDASIVWMEVATDMVNMYEIPPDPRMELVYMFAEQLVRDAVKAGA